MSNTHSPSFRDIVICILILASVGCIKSVEPDTQNPLLQPPNLDEASNDSVQNQDPTSEDTLGGEFWSVHCQRCHGNFSIGSNLSLGNANGDFRLDAQATVDRHGDELETYIAQTMPTDGPTNCIGDCAIATGSYIRSRIEPSIPVDCDVQNIAYGQRELKLLTSVEYQTTLEILLGVPDDFGSRIANNNGYIGGFLNMSGRALSGTLLETYMANAEAIAEWAIQNGRPFACSDTNQCADRFIREFLFTAFRGEVTEAQESAYRSLIRAEGLQLAIEAALTSPYFLYRIEAGIPVSEARNLGYYTGNAEPPSLPESDPGPIGDDIETIDHKSFSPGSQGQLENDAWALVENGRVRLSFTTPLAVPSVIRVRARGSQHGDIWPELTVYIGSTRLGTQTIDTQQFSDYRFDTQGITGTQEVILEFANDSGVPPYSQGLDVNIYFAEVGLIIANSAPPEAPPPSDTGPSEDLLADIDPDVYVLTPHEYISALSFRLTGGAPTYQQLLAVSRLASKRAIKTLVNQLLNSVQGRKHVSNFVIDWFGLGELPRLSRPNSPSFTPEVKQAMLQELRTHFGHVFYNNDVPFSELYGSNYSFLNQTLADYYEIPGNFTPEFVKTEVPRRGGPIASGAFMAINAHADRSGPIPRAVHVREDALCHYIDPPNAPIAGGNIDEQRAQAQMRVSAQEAQDGVLSSRDFYFLYTDGIEACASCHEKVINPMFGMEDFDNVGRLRPLGGQSEAIETIDGGTKTVSLSGTLYGVSSTADATTLSFEGAKDLSNQIANTEAAKSCFARKSFRFFTGWTYLDRDLDISQQESLSSEQRNRYGCIASEMLDVFSTNNDSPQALVTSLASNPFLMLRRDSTP